AVRAGDLGAVERGIGRVVGLQRRDGTDLRASDGAADGTLIQKGDEPLNLRHLRHDTILPLTSDTWAVAIGRRCQALPVSRRMLAFLNRSNESMSPRR